MAKTRANRSRRLTFRTFPAIRSFVPAVTSLHVMMLAFGARFGSRMRRNRQFRTRRTPCVYPSASCPLHCSLFSSPHSQLTGNKLRRRSLTTSRRRPQPTAELTIPPDAVQKPNPVKPTPAVLPPAKKTWGYDCAMCHGADGCGKGDLAGDMKLKLLDYRDPDSLKNHDGRRALLDYHKGKGQMSGEGSRAETA